MAPFLPRAARPMVHSRFCSPFSVACPLSLFRHAGSSIPKEATQPTDMEPIPRTEQARFVRMLADCLEAGTLHDSRGYLGPPPSPSSRHRPRPSGSPPPPGGWLRLRLQIHRAAIGPLPALCPVAPRQRLVVTAFDKDSNGGPAAYRRANTPSFPRRGCTDCRPCAGEKVDRHPPAPGQGPSQGRRGPLVGAAERMRPHDGRQRAESNRHRSGWHRNHAPGAAHRQPPAMPSMVCPLPPFYGDVGRSAATIPPASGSDRSGSAWSHWSAQRVSSGRETASARSQTGHRSGWPRNHAPGFQRAANSRRRPKAAPPAPRPLSLPVTSTARLAARIEEGTTGLPLRLDSALPRELAQRARFPGIRHQGAGSRAADDSSSFCRRFHG